MGRQMKLILSLFIIYMSLGLLLGCNSETSDTTESHSSQSGNGSITKFTTQSGFLVTLNERDQIKTFDLSTPLLPELKWVYSVTIEPETLYPYKSDLLLIGSRQGALILTVLDDGSLQERSFISHEYGCDPVVADQDIMYVTVRSSRGCGQTRSNVLLIFDISNPDDPVEIGELSIEQPKGLALADNDQLFVCSTEGLIDVDITDPTTPVVRERYENISCRDLIAFEGDLITQNQDGIQIYTIDQLPLLISEI